MIKFLITWMIVSVVVGLLWGQFVKAGRGE